MYTYIHTYIHTYTFIHTYIHTKRLEHHILQYADADIIVLSTSLTYTHSFIYSCIHTCIHTYIHMNAPVSLGSRAVFILSAKRR